MQQKENKKIPKSRWPEYFKGLSEGSRGRLIRVSRFEGEMEQKALEEKLPLLALSYDPHHDGILFISAGKNQIEYEHEVQGPEQIWVDEDNDGRARSMQITDAEGTKTVVTFEQ